MVDGFEPAAARLASKSSWLLSMRREGSVSGEEEEDGAVAPLRVERGAMVVVARG